MKKVIQVIVYIDYETDERAGSIGADSIGGVGLIFEGEDGIIHDYDLGLIGHMMANMDSKDIVTAIRRAGFLVDDNVQIDQENY